jgi:hypothetical protein
VQSRRPPDAGRPGHSGHEHDRTLLRWHPDILRDDYRALFDRLPVGWSEVFYAGRRYGVTRSVAAGGRALAIYAEELGGRDVISANLFLTAGGALLKPCEMPAAKVLDFLLGLEFIRTVT